MDEKRILEPLNGPQREAVLYRGGPLLVLAGAGSGKTRVLTHRIAALAAEGVPTFNILAVTFTNKAAAQMRQRVLGLVNREVWVATFHATCLAILRAEGRAIGLPAAFSVYDEQDGLVVLKDCCEELGLNERQVHPKALREAISRAKDELKGPDDVQVREYWDEVVVKVYRLYEKKLAQCGALDFGDLIAKTVALFLAPGDVLSRTQDRFKHVLIDEYQDVNHAQYRFVSLLASRNRQLAVVGDPDQSIYAWRGADIRNILDFRKDYPNAKVVKLEQNYRSTATILAAANALIRNNPDRVHKELWSELGEGEAIDLYEARDEADEARGIVEQVRSYRAGGLSLRDMAVFYRVHAQSRVLEDLLIRERIPYQMIGDMRFYDRREVKDVISYLRLLVFERDEVSFKRVLNVPARGLGEKALAAIERAARERGGDWARALADAAAIGGLSERARRAAAAFGHMVLALRKRAEEVAASELLGELLAETGYLAALEREGTLESKVRAQNVRELASALQEFEADSAEPRGAPPALSGRRPGGLLQFLESVSLQTEMDRWSPEEARLTLMTLHMAKGLEFPIVFLAGLEEELFPHSSAMAAGRDELAEERRLCYVGITRAKQKLHVSFANARRLYGTRMYNLPSRFLNEIPASLYRYVGHAEGGADGETRFEEDEVFDYGDGAL